MTKLYDAFAELASRLHAAAIGRPCERCGKPIEPGQSVSFEYEGPNKPARASHSSCFEVREIPVRLQ